MIEADIVKNGRGGETGDVSAEVAGLAVGAHHHCEGVPANVGADFGLVFVVAGRGGLLRGGDGVDVGGVGGIGKIRAVLAGEIDECLRQKMGALRPVDGDDRLHRLAPFARFFRVNIGGGGIGGVRQNGGRCAFNIVVVAGVVGHGKISSPLFYSRLSRFS